MNLFEPLQPKEIIIDDKKYIISLIPATESIKVVSYFASGVLPLLVGKPQVIQEFILKLLNYVFVEKVGLEKPLQLSSDALINAHVPPRFKTISALANEVWKYNVEDFQIGRNSDSFGGFVQNFKPKDLKTLIQSLVRLLQKVEHLSENSEPSIA